MDTSEFKRLENETDEEVIFRICSMKEQIGSWQDVANILNNILNTEYTESKFRKQFNAFQKMLNANQNKILNNDNYIKQIRLEKQEVRKEKEQLFDERKELYRMLRDRSRYEDVVTKMENVFSSIGDKRYLSYSPIEHTASDNDLIVCLADLHLGAQYYGFSGCYDSDIAKERLNTYLRRIIEIYKTHRAQNCHVVLLGDMISGNIYKIVSITNRENVVEQIKLACEYVADFVYTLGQYFENVNVYSVSGNHSRLDTFKDSLLDERLDTLISWFLKNTLKNCKNIHIQDDNIDDTFTVFTAKDKLYIGVHGDHDHISDGEISKLILWSGITPYCILSGHNHFPAMSEVADIKVIQSGSLCGSGDDNTRKKRLKGKPSQTVLVVNDEGIVAHYPITLS